MRIKTVLRTITLAVTVLAVGLAGLHAQQDSSKTGVKPPDEETAKRSRTDIQQALSPLNSLISEWRGSGQVRRGSNFGAWQETATFVWKFTDGTVGIEYQVKKGKHLRTALLSWDASKKQYTMGAVLADGSKRAYRGKFEKKSLILESVPGDDEFDFRVTIRQHSEKRLIVFYEKRRANQKYYRRVAEVGYTRKGTRLASSDSTGPVCVVTGGTGTIKVSHNGKTYYVCCTGCRDAFNDDPEQILAEYRDRLTKKSAQSE